MQTLDQLIDFTARLWLRPPPAESRDRHSALSDSFEPLSAQLRAFEARMIAVMFLISIGNVLVVTLLLWIFFRS